MLSETEARQFAAGWVLAWNCHDLDAVMYHHAPDVVLTSPAAERLLSDPSGTVVGKEAVRRYFERGLEAYPNLTFELLDVMWGVGETPWFVTRVGLIRQQA
jgi:ketosteroid isomerase-like protein